MKKKYAVKLFFAALLAAFTLTACTDEEYRDLAEIIVNDIPLENVGVVEDTANADTSSAIVPDATPIYDNNVYIPEYTGQDVIVLNGNIPDFYECTTDSYEFYSDLDHLGRCGMAIACVGTDLMPTEERGEIGSIKPTGWIQEKYDMSVTGSDSPYLYNRCHLIGYQLTGENANEKNLITGTRQMNVEMMLPYENAVTQYVRSTGNHVMYRVTPIFEEEELLARGVQMEAYSVEDEGAGICFNVFCYNVERGITIDYLTGASSGPEFTGSNDIAEDEASAEPIIPDDISYVLNTNSMKFHLPDCESVGRMSEHNMLCVDWDRETCMQSGYSPCGACNP